MDKSCEERKRGFDNYFSALEALNFLEFENFDLSMGNKLGLGKDLRFLTEYVVLKQKDNSYFSQIFYYYLSQELEGKNLID